MNIAIEQPQPQQAVAWRIEFADRPLAAEAPDIAEPRTAWVRAQEVSAPTVLLDTATPDSNLNGLTFVFLPSGAATPFEVRRQAENWMTSRSGENANSLEVQFRSERLLWRRDRAICFGSPQVMDEIFTAVARFSFCEGELAKLEAQIKDAWVTLEGDIELVKRVSSRNLRRQRHIDAMTRTTTRMRVAHVRIQAALETPASDLAGPARRLFMELALQANTDHRLEMLDDAIDAVDDFYLHLREQFSEFRNFIRDYRVSVLILLVLLINDLLLLSLDKIIAWLPIVAR
jgi:hypothetical protein